MHPLIGQREHDALVDILHEVDLVLHGREPQHIPVVLALLVREADQQPAVVVDRNAAVLQAAVALDDDMARDAHVDHELRLGTVQPHVHVARAVLDVPGGKGLEELATDLEIKVVQARFQPLVRDRICFSDLHLYAFSAQSY